MPSFIDLTGQRFERLIVIGRADDYISPKGKSSVRWNCLCDCGKECVVLANVLRRGLTRSCGCLVTEKIVKFGSENPKYIHGFWKNRLYYVWKNMKQRCFCKTSKDYSNYGGRGVTICDEWKDDYQAFHDWAMATGYDENAPRGQCTIDRIDVNGNYCPENCRWISAKVQGSNKRNTRFIVYEGSTYTVGQLAEKLKVSYATVLYRLKKGVYKEVKKCQD